MDFCLLCFGSRQSCNVKPAAQLKVSLLCMYKITTTSPYFDNLKCDVFDMQCASVPLCHVSFA